MEEFLDGLEMVIVMVGHSEVKGRPRRSKAVFCWNARRYGRRPTKRVQVDNRARLRSRCLREISDELDGHLQQVPIVAR